MSISRCTCKRHHLQPLSHYIQSQQWQQMDNSTYEIVRKTNQPSNIELDTICEKVDLDKPEDAQPVTRQGAKIATFKPTCKLSIACFMTVAILALLLALLTLSLTTWILTTDSAESEYTSSSIILVYQHCVLSQLLQKSFLCLLCLILECWQNQIIPFILYYCSLSLILSNNILLEAQACMLV